MRARLGGLKIPLDRPVGTLSGGQRAQLALALTLAKRPRLLLLDEPLAALDPLARRSFLAALAEAAAGGDLTIVLSSHLIADIERVCDHLILLAESRVQLCGDIETLLAQHRILTGPRKDTTAIARTHAIVREDTTARQTTLLVRLNGPVIDPAWAVEEPNLEEIVLGYMSQDEAGHGAGPAGRPPVGDRRRPMTWVTWRQYRYQGALAAALFAVLAVVLLITGLHAAQVWHSALAGCAKNGTCGQPVRLSLSLSSPSFRRSSSATSAVPLLPGLFWGAPMVAHELETGTNQFAWTQSITRRRWLAVRAGWLLLAAAVLAGAVSALVTWWSGPDNALNADAFQVNRFDITDIVPVGYAVFAMALGICAGALLRRTLPALAVTLAGFAALRALTALWLRLHYMTPVTVYYKLTAPFTPERVLPECQPGHRRPERQAPGRRPRQLRVQRRTDPGRMREVHPAQPRHPAMPDGARLPGVPDLPAGQQVLGLPGHRDRHLRGPRRRPARRHVLGAQAAGRIARRDSGWPAEYLPWHTGSCR